MPPRKRILIFIDWFTPGYKAGGPISSNANLIDHLKDDLDFYVLTRNTDYCENIPYPSIEADSWHKLNDACMVFYFSQSGLSFKNIISTVKKIQYDLVYINGTYSRYFSLFPLIYFRYFRQCPVIVSARGMLSDHSFSSKKGKKKLFYFLAHLFGLYKGITFHATNNDEALSIRKNLLFNGNIKVAPNLSPKIRPAATTIEKKEGTLKLISIARISTEKNTLFSLNALEKCKDFEITLDLYGTIYNEYYWESCKAIISSLPGNIKVSYMGTIEKSLITEKIEQYHFMILPSLGENYGHSIAESFLAARPVIISDQTPWKNLQNPRLTDNVADSSVPVGWDLSLQDIKAWKDVIDYCARMKQDEFNAMCQAASNFAIQYINNPEVLKANLELFNITP